MKLVKRYIDLLNNSDVPVVVQTPKINVHLGKIRTILWSIRRVSFHENEWLRNLARPNDEVS